jgi:hypothetical protein
MLVQADEAEASGFYPDRGRRAMHDSGLFRMKAPRELGVIERCMRDVVAGAQHGMVNDVAYEARGQIVLGVEGVAALN